MLGLIGGLGAAIFVAGCSGVELCGAVHPRTVIPVHYEGWSHFSEGRAAIEQALETASPEVRDSFQFVPIGTPVDIV